MGITGLFPLLKDITCDVHLRSFSGKVAAIDVYCWLLETVVFCVEEIILGIETTRYIDVCMKDTDLLIENNVVLLWLLVQPILVFQKKLSARQKWNPPSLTC
ncbi:unnamed protein product [Porites evermanni]|uniref:XPG N-terminal domain-containing protein n=1 Tax=Porites evermanni TaxID=104178 RepID=A0ABN8T4P0_9CNID|nr:unnamed protein product [Porites evermanni]